jgi:hypothetical protein
MIGSAPARRFDRTRARATCDCKRQVAYEDADRSHLIVQSIISRSRSREWTKKLAGNYRLL